ncbi:S4 domain-containing protein [Escherichia coli]
MRWKGRRPDAGAGRYSELQPSRGQARKIIASNAITINGEKQSDPEYFFKEEDRCLVVLPYLRRGKKNYWSDLLAKDALSGKGE